MSLNEHREIIIEALVDYKRWFSNHNNEIDEGNEERVKDIDEAIKFMNN